VAYLLIFDLDGRSNIRRKVNRYLQREARMVQHSVWRFQDIRALHRAAEFIFAAGGRALAFVESDRIFLARSEVKQFLEGVLNRTSCLK
jgi:hypothetical protein